ncbi:hypothetical protein JXM67_05200 [candidate division WOR-3 bacterium]|nr:hypothetical protein [candidate division WOR-3 bacterium]
MKRFLACLGLITLFLGVSCEVFEGRNKIQYPVDMSAIEVPGDTITLEFRFEFFDETPDSTGIGLSADWNGSELNILLRGNEEGDEDAGSFSNIRYLNVGRPENGTYTVTFEGEKQRTEQFSLTVTDSAFSADDFAGDLVNLYWDNDRRLFTDMLLVEIGYMIEEEPVVTFVRDSLVALGAVEITLPEGSYSIFAVESDGTAKGSRVESPDWKTAGFDGSVSLLFSYEGKESALDEVFTTYDDDLAALSIRTGRGFDRTER